MTLTPLALLGAWSIDVEPTRDERGFFARVLDTAVLAAAGLHDSFPQHSIARNARAGTLRGMHFSLAPYEETKIVRCTAGAAFDVIVDVRPTSPTYREWLAFSLTAENHRALYVPPGFAHGYQALVDETEVLYLISPAYVPGYGSGIRYDDRAVAIDWPLPVSHIADRDRSWPALP